MAIRCPFRHARPRRGRPAASGAPITELMSGIEVRADMIRAGADYREYFPGRRRDYARPAGGPSGPSRTTGWESGHIYRQKQGVEGKLNAELRISANDPLGELVSLMGRLKKQNELTDKVRPVYRAPTHNEPGGAVEAIAVDLDADGAGPALAEAIAAWLADRGPDVNVTVTTPAGTVTIDAGRLAESLDVLRKIVT
ncbi:hypothetical protein AB0K60_29840 [Thermopolyspora sp. NPDC052614]|uniref:effector-associated constant component EACC1 n=1 Tax=Thermopolyspora sp. NPDC052614 TaxID=3155682 RepID=UPI00343843E1